MDYSFLSLKMCTNIDKVNKNTIVVDISKYYLNVHTFALEIAPPDALY